MTHPFDAQYETLLLDRPVPHVLTVTLNRPDSRNAFDSRMATELLTIWQTLAHDPDDIRTAILTGAGDKAFCAGADLKERKGLSDTEWRAQHRLFEDMAYALMDSPVPVVAAVNGAAYGGGCELALACDFAYASENARFALTEVTIGLIPGIGGTQNLPRRIGLARAKEILLTGRAFDAQQASDWGLVNRLCPPERLMQEVLSTAERIAGNAPLAVAQALKAADDGMQTSLAQGLSIELECYRALVGTKDVREGVAAFNEKRKPVFKGK